MTLRAGTLRCTEVRLCRSLGLLGFHVNGHMGVFTELFLELVLYRVGVVMRLGQSYVSAHKYVQFNGVAVSYTACLKVMRLNHVGLGCGYAHNFVLNVIR